MVSKGVYVAVDLWAWIAFIAAVAVLLTLDLFVFHRNAHVISAREAALWSAFWIGLGLAFGVVVWTWQGGDAGGEYFAGYLIEKSLAVDNVFVFVLIFSALAIPPVYHHRVLFWGVVGAIALRAMFILVGAALIDVFHWILYAFGLLLVYTGVKMARGHGVHIDPETNRALALTRRFIRFTSTTHGQSFFVRHNGVMMATPLFAALVLIEVSDVVFAIDSIPAIFAVTDDPYIAFTSNIAAILGLRALYFLVADMSNRFAYLKIGLAAILVFVGAKMLLADLYKVPVWASLGVIGLVLATSIAASLRKPVPAEADPAIPDPFGLLGSGQSKPRERE